MDLTRKLIEILKISLPYVGLVLGQLCLSIFMILVQSITSEGVSALAIVVYEHIIATILLLLLSILFEKNGRPPFSYKIICYGFLLGGLQITLCQMLLTMSLDLVSSTYQSIALNMVPMVVFVLALILRQEKVEFCSVNGQAKVWGLVVSVAGALILVLWEGSVVFQSTKAGLLGGLMIVVGVLATSFWNILVKHVTSFYPAELSLTTMMSLFGTIQTSIVSVFVLDASAWKLEAKGAIPTVLLGGVLVTGLSYYVMTWVIKKRGPVFVASFNPLLVVFSFLLQTFVFGDAVHLGSIVGAVLVISGLYLLLWAKANDENKIKVDVDDMSASQPFI